MAMLEFTLINATRANWLGDLKGVTVHKVQVTKQGGRPSHAISARMTPSEGIISLRCDSLEAVDRVKRFAPLIDDRNQSGAQSFRQGWSDEKPVAAFRDLDALVPEGPGASCD